MDLGAGRMTLPELDSTNAEGFRRAASLTRPTWILAGVQTAGRGRRARPWSSPRGNFHGTLVLKPAEPPETVALRSFAAALALRDAFVALTGLPQSFALKWPNDVLCNGGKIAGILLESQGLNTPATTLCIGIGVNLIAAPDASQIEAGAVPPVSLLHETGLKITPEAFLDALAPAYAAWETTFTTQGFA
ncbi:MAG: biotin--[acetyl-CoA-carboxylase] ligase, partial [Acetobacteraceae bacterium]